MKVVTIVRVLKDKLEGPQINYQGKELQMACTQGPEEEALGRGWQSPSTQHVEETKHRGRSGFPFRI